MYGTASEHELLYQYSLVGARNVILGMIQTESPYFQGRSFALASKCADRSPMYPDPDCSRRYAPGRGIPSTEYKPSQEDRAIGLHLECCHSIFVLGAGLYSFFDSYAQDTLPDHACQRRLCIVDDQGQSSDIWLFQLATVGCEVLLTVQGFDRLLEGSHREGFCSTLGLCAIRPASRQSTELLLI